MLPLSLFDTVRRHWTWLRGASERLCQFSPERPGEAGKRVVMRSLVAGAALDPPLWTVVPNKALSLSLSLSQAGGT